MIATPADLSLLRDRGPLPISEIRQGLAASVTEGNVNRAVRSLVAVGKLRPRPATLTRTLLSRGGPYERSYQATVYEVK